MRARRDEFRRVRGEICEIARFRPVDVGCARAEALPQLRGCADRVVGVHAVSPRDACTRDIAARGFERGCSRSRAARARAASGDGAAQRGRAPARGGTWVRQRRRAAREEGERLQRRPRLPRVLALLRGMLLRCAREDGERLEVPRGAHVLLRRSLPSTASRLSQGSVRPRG